MVNFVERFNEDVEGYVLGGFLQPVPFTPTFVVPYFTREGTDGAFVQSLNQQYQIIEFADYDIDSVPSAQLIQGHRRIYRRIGDSGVVGVLIENDRLIWGTRDTVAYELMRSVRDCSVPSFFRVEVASFLRDEVELRLATKAAASCFLDTHCGLRWLKREEKNFAFGGVLTGPERLAAQWARILVSLEREFGSAEYHVWLHKMTLIGLEGDEIIVHLPTRFLRDWVGTHYGDRITELWRSENRDVRRVNIRVGTTSGASNGLTNLLDVTTQPSSGKTLNSLHVEGKHDPRSEMRPEVMTYLDPRFTFASFVVGKPNEFAYACARRVSQLPNTPGFNPLFLYGGVGLGKTHLMNAIALELTSRVSASDNPEGRPVSIAFMSAEKFMYRFIAAIRTQSTTAFKESLRSVDVLMIDDLQFLVGKDNTQEEFFHTFNALVNAGKQIVVSADKSPTDLSGLEERLRTRLNCGMVADLHAPTYELRISILEAKAALARIVLPQNVMELLARRFTSNVRELEGSLNRVIAHANLVSTAITIETTQELLHDVLRGHERKLPIQEIQRVVAEHYNLRLGDMTSARRALVVARPRQVAIYLSKQFTTRSMPAIGRTFGNRDHTTVRRACTKVKELMERDASFAEEVEILRGLLEGELKKLNE